MTVRLIYSERQLRDLVARYQAGAQPEIDTAMLLGAVHCLFESLDQARTQCVALAGKAPRETWYVATEMFHEVRDKLAASLRQPHDDTVGNVIDAVISLVDYLEHGHFRRAAPVQAESRS